MEKAERILAECRQILADYRQQIERPLGDPRVSQWREISFEMHGELLRTLGVSTEAGKAAGRFHQQANSILEQIDSCRNELASQETDLRLASTPPERALATATNLARECGHLRQPLADLQHQLTMLYQAEKTLRQRLRIESLITLAGKRSRARGDAFDAGYRVFSLVTGLGTSSVNLKSFQEELIEATELKSRLQHVDLQGLPCLAAEIVYQQVAFAIDTIEQVKNILGHAEQSLSHELATIRCLTARTADLSKAPLPEIMQNVNEIVTGLSDCVLNFSPKQHIVRRLQAVTVVLEDLKLFNRALRSDVLSTLKAEIGKPGSPLNPATIAARNAGKYFAGLKGFWRMIKLFFQSKAGGKAMDALSLQLALEQAIGNCTAYRGSREVDLEGLRAFMASRLKGYGRPFPYDELYRLMRATLDAYAARIEKSLYGYRLDGELLKEFSAGAAFLKAGSLTFGKLLRDVQRQASTLERGLA